MGDEPGAECGTTFTIATRNLAREAIFLRRRFLR